MANFEYYSTRRGTKKNCKFVIYGHFLGKEQLLLLIIYIDSALLGSPN